MKILFILIVVILLVAVLLMFFVYNPSSSEKAKLSIESVEFDPNFQLSLSKGCLTEINGSISNIGDTAAEGITINCNVIGSGATGETEGIKNIGFLNQGEDAGFKMIINNDCPAPHDVECSVSCENCEHIVYGGI